MLGITEGPRAENLPKPVEPNASGDSFVYDSKGKKDPFLPGEFAWTTARTLSKLRESRLDGIVWDDVNPLIILDGNVLKVGDSYIGARVVSIEKDKAIFSIGDEKVAVLVADAK